LLQTPSNNLADFYSIHLTGLVERVAGFDADVVELLSKDELRFGYRIWAEKKTGLVVKLQTLDADRRVLEQVAFSELLLDAPVRMTDLIKMMKNTRGYAVQQSAAVRTTPESQGWHLKAGVPGFSSMSCHMRSDLPGTSSQTAGGSHAAMQWVFSDGLASVSVFVEAFDPNRHGGEATTSSGATHSVNRRLDDYWLTVVGEVPLATLRQFALQMERIR
jgi:sigma-E factor negative regulatory protein RseB